jgi:hypothetical protein
MAGVEGAILNELQVLRSSASTICMPLPAVFGAMLRLLSKIRDSESEREAALEKSWKRVDQDRTREFSGAESGIAERGACNSLQVCAAAERGGRDGSVIYSSGSNCRAAVLMLLGVPTAHSQETFQTRSSLQRKTAPTIMP